MSVEITEDELFAELRKLKVAPRIGLSDLQYRLIEEARSGDRALPWNDIVDFMNAKFGTEYTRKELTNKYYFERDMRR